MILFTFRILISRVDVFQCREYFLAGHIPNDDCATVVARRDQIALRFGDAQNVLSVTFVLIIAIEPIFGKAHLFQSLVIILEDIDVFIPSDSQY